MSDVVYAVRQGKSNEQLRYSLRSLRNLPHGTVWIAGYKPPWVTNVEHLPTDQRKSRWENSTTNLAAACACAAVPDEFVYMNDDFYITEPIDRVPILHRGTLTDVIDSFTRQSSYVRGMKAAAAWLREHGYGALCYELHVPFPVVKAQMADTLRCVVKQTAPAKRSLYGNWWRIGGEQTADCKAVEPGVRPFASTSPKAFAGPLGEWIKGLFPDPSPYEGGA